MLSLAVAPRPVVLRRPAARKLVMPAKADMIETTGKFIGLFVLFTSSMNWWHYRRIRKSLEEKDPKN